MKTPHKHAELIKAWADGAEIECRRYEYQAWKSCETPQWHADFEYRINPEPKPDVITYAKVEIGLCNVYIYTHRADKGNLKLTFDGGTGKLKSAEVL